MKKYVLGIAETEDNEIVLIKKNNPEWQKGLYNLLWIYEFCIDIDNPFMRVIYDGQ